MHQMTALDIAMDWTLSINMLPSFLSVSVHNLRVTKIDDLTEVFTSGAICTCCVNTFRCFEEITPISLYRVGFEDVLLRLEDAKSQD